MLIQTSKKGINPYYTMHEGIYKRPYRGTIGEPIDPPKGKHITPIEGTRKP